MSRRPGAGIAHHRRVIQHLFHRRFDFDPGSGEFADAARAGLRIKEALDALGAGFFFQNIG
jgi:DNA primase